MHCPLCCPADGVQRERRCHVEPASSMLLQGYQKALTKVVVMITEMVVMMVVIVRVVMMAAQ